MMTTDAAGKLFAPTIMLVVALAVSGCGLQGDLYLPEAEPQPQPAQETATPGSDTGDQTDDESPESTTDRQN